LILLGRKYLCQLKKDQETGEPKRKAIFYAMNQQRCTRHDGPLRTPSNHGVPDDIVCIQPSDVGCIRIMIRSEDELQSLEEKQQHHSGRCTEADDDLRSSLDYKSVLRENYAAEGSSSHEESLSQRSQHSSDRITQTPSDANLTAYRVDNMNTRFGRYDYTNEERYANLGVGVMSSSEHIASKREQDMYSATNRSGQPHHNFNVSGWQQTWKSPPDGKDEGHCRGGSDGYSRWMIDQRDQDLHCTTNRTDQPHQHYNVSSWQQTRNSSTDGIEGNSAGGSVEGYIGRTVEISPGVYVRLRGAEETWDCIRHDFFMPCTCFGCSHELCCIQDADYVLCPKCRVVSPMDTTSSGYESANAAAASSTSSTADIEHEGGVGLGFTFDDLLKWQAEIIQGRDFQS
jgi:hypothetical protein